ncbi:hypothetical protein [Neobacillus jeddahensis]|uniref:hypothetical protein n=1 Tax=Neobacillus jeddahensis TaxID=1461580 RepID=UPI00058CE914|nr:hypothetical protein [Neobacillus jeddahensis]
MPFFEPKDKNLKKVDWEVSQKNIDLVKAYADYTENEVVEYYLNCNREDNNNDNLIKNNTYLL